MFQEYLLSSSCTYSLRMYEWDVTQFACVIYFQIYYQFRIKIVQMFYLLRNYQTRANQGWQEAECLMVTLMVVTLRMPTFLVSDKSYVTKFLV